MPHPVASAVSPVKILIVKVSSLGDVVHTLPAVSDAARVIPGLTVDWVVEPGFAAIPRLHPAVRRVIEMNQRAWRRAPRDAWASGAIGRFWTALRAERYDRVIDPQGLVFKSAVPAWLAHGPVHGFALGAVREGAAALLYRHRHAIAPDLHAIDRVRSLFGAALGYQPGDLPFDYGIDRKRLAPGPVDPRRIVFLHGTAWHTKQWTVARWRDLAIRAGGEQFRVILPQHGAEERERASAIAAGMQHVEILPEGGLEPLAQVIAGSGGFIGCDTGLVHLAAALGVPGVTLYGPTTPKLTGTRGHAQAQLVPPGFDCVPCRQRRCRLTGREEPPPCLESLTPESVWATLRAQLAA
jgi:heptosyltransferase I